MLLIGYLVVSVIFFGSLAFMASQPTPALNEELHTQLLEGHSQVEHELALRSA